MTYQNPLTPAELIEYAALDVYGLLDSDEADHYARSLRFAPDAVREQVVELQAQIASDESFLPDAEPPDSLRELVLERVASAVEADPRFRPLGRIGSDEPVVATVVERPSLMRSAGFWRAAALVFFSVGLVFAYVWNDAYSRSMELAQLALADDASAKLRDLIGPDFEDFARGPNTRKVVLRPQSDSDFAGMAVIYLKENTGQALVVGLDLPELNEGKYHLRMVNGGDTRDFAEAFTVNGLYATIRISGIAAEAMATAVFEIVGPNNNVLLTTRQV